LSEKAQAIIDRPARDWLVALIENALVSQPEPDAVSTIDFSPCNKTKDPIILDAIRAIEDYLNAPLQLNGAGTTPVILNLEDERRRMNNLVTFLRSDLPYEVSRWPTMMWGNIFLLIAIAIIFALILNPPWSTYSMMILHSIFYVGICAIIILIFITLFSFIWHRWFSPPKLNTDENDHWPFSSYEQLLAERERQRQEVKNAPEA